MADRHPGITMHKLPVGGGFIGLLFALGCSTIFVLGFPTLWYFVALTFVLGVAIAIFLRLAGRYRSERNKPLSILQPEIKQPAAQSAPARNRFHPKPLLAS
jgi:hypothetical protein